LRCRSSAGCPPPANTRRPRAIRIRPSSGRPEVPRSPFPSRRKTDQEGGAQDGVRQFRADAEDVPGFPRRTSNVPWPSGPRSRMLEGKIE
jgi:hypothetical protein